MKRNTALLISLAAFIGAAAGPARCQDNSNLIGYWPANEGTGATVSNVVNSDTNGALNEATWSADGEGHTGSAGDYAFRVSGEPGGGSNVEVPETNVDFSEITITAWIKGAPTGDWTGIVYSRGSRAIGLDFHGGSGTVNYTWNDNSAETWNFSSDLVIPEEEWTFVAMSLTAEGCTLYVGTTGELTSVTNEIEHIPQSHDSAPFLFGVDLCCGDGRNFEGLMDDIAIWDVALTEEHLESLWNGSVTPLNVFDGPGGLPFQITSLDQDVATNEITVTWNSSPKSTYAIFWSNNLVDLIELDDGIQGEEGSTSFVDTVPAETSVRYYQVVEQR